MSDNRPLDCATSGHISTFSLTDDSTHPTQIALRTYALSLTLTLGPALVSFIVTSLKLNSSKTSTPKALKELLRRELGPDGFAFAITLAVASGAGLRRLLGKWHAREAIQGGVRSQEKNGHGLRNLLRRIRASLFRLNLEQQTFLSNIVSSSFGIILLQAGRSRVANLRVRNPSNDRISSTLDLTLLLLVRALDSGVQRLAVQRFESSPTTDDGEQLQTLKAPPVNVDGLVKGTSPRHRQTLTSQIDAFVFWACSARIMWCFFYEPHRLPRSYVKWINALANLDGRIIQALQHIRAGTWSYGTRSPKHIFLLQASARDLGYPESWGNPSILPAYGGKVANEIWNSIGVRSRSGVGGIPCEILHGQVGSSLGLTASCTANAGLRLLRGFVDAMAIYLPVYLVPTLLTRPRTLPPPHRFLEMLSGALRSSAFLSSFIGLYWYSVCLTRTVVLARLFPHVSHDFWDGPYGCIMAGCLMCGSSIWIENGGRRGEMALYVLPRAVRACLPDRWVRSGRWGVKIAERVAFVFSLATLLTAATHRPDSLRGLSRWTLAFIMNGPNAVFWRRRPRDPCIPLAPSVPPRDLDNDEEGSTGAPRLR